MCDGHYRTFDGLRTLVHKEWHFYKYDFLKRDSNTDNLVEPAFILMLDAL